MPHLRLLKRTGSRLPHMLVAGLFVRRTLGSMQSSLQSRFVVQKTMIRLLPPAPYTLTMSLIVLDRLFFGRDGANKIKKTLFSQGQKTDAVRTTTKTYT